MSPFELRLADKSWATEMLSSVSLRRGGKVVAGSYLLPPYSVRVSGDGLLLFDWTGPPVSTPRAQFRSSSQQSRKVDVRLWQQFAGLAQADDDAVRRFAERWGPLRFGTVSSYAVTSERLAEWRYFATLARAVGMCSVAIKQGRLGDVEDWKHICDWLDSFYQSDLVTDARDPVIALQRRALVASALNRWYSRSSGHTLLALQGDKLVVAPAAMTLSGILGVQLAYSITSAEEMLVCYHCTRFFTPKRKPSTGVRTFCPACREAGKPQLYCMRAHRARSRK